MFLNLKMAAPSSKSKRKDIVWSDDEAELLLSVVHDYKVSKATENTDWESVKSKYKDIHGLLIAQMIIFLTKKKSSPRQL